MTLVNPSFLAMYKKSRWAKHNVAAAWAEGRALSPSGNIVTDGDIVTSYGHIIGHTEPDGTKVAHDCHYSATTRQHVGVIRPFADKVVEVCHPGAVIKVQRRKRSR